VSDFASEPGQRHDSEAPRLLRGRQSQMLSVASAEPCQATSTGPQADRGWLSTAGTIDRDSVMDIGEDEEHTCYEALCSFVRGVKFDYLSGAFVLFNAAVLGILTDWQARNVTLKTPLAFHILEIVFCFIFTVELILRVVGYGKEFFALRYLKWHLVDCVLVGFQLLELSFDVASNSVLTDTPDSKVTANWSALRILRVLRLIRVIRLVRILRLISELRMLIISIIGSLRALVWAVTLLFLMIYVMSIYLTQLVLDHRLSDMDQTSLPAGQLVRFYGSLGDTVLSIYQAISGGVDWSDILDPLSSQISTLITPFFMFYIAFATLCMLNVITGVFVESALLTAKRDKESYMVNSVHSVFGLYDKDGSGTLSRAQFHEALESQELMAVLATLDIDTSEAGGLFELIDIDRQGELSAEAFASGCARLHGPAKALELGVLLRTVQSLEERVHQHIASTSGALHQIFLALERGASRGGDSGGTGSSSHNTSMWASPKHSGRTASMSGVNLPGSPIDMEEV